MIAWMPSRVFSRQRQPFAQCILVVGITVRRVLRVSLPLAYCHSAIRNDDGMCTKQILKKNIDRDRAGFVEAIQVQGAHILQPLSVPFLASGPIYLEPLKRRTNLQHNTLRSSKFGLLGTKLGSRRAEGY